MEGHTKENTSKTTKDNSLREPLILNRNNHQSILPIKEDSNTTPACALPSLTTPFFPSYVTFSLIFLPHSLTNLLPQFGYLSKKGFVESVTFCTENTTTKQTTYHIQSPHPIPNSFLFNAIHRFHYVSRLPLPTKALTNHCLREGCV